MKPERTIKFRSLINGKYLSVNVKCAVSGLVSMSVIHLNGGTQVVGHDGALSVTSYLCGRDERPFLEDPCGQAVPVRAGGFLLSVIVRSSGNPFVQRCIAVPYPACDLSEIPLGGAASQRIVAELYGPSVRTYYPPEHTAGCPLVYPSHIRNRTPYSVLPFHLPAVMPYRILPWLSELAENEVTLVIVVVDAFRILQQPSSGTVPSVLPLRRTVKVSHEVRHAVYHVRSGPVRCGR